MAFNTIESESTDRSLIKQTVCNDNPGRHISQDCWNSADIGKLQQSCGSSAEASSHLPPFSLSDESNVASSAANTAQNQLANADSDSHMRDAVHGGGTVKIGTSASESQMRDANRGKGTVKIGTDSEHIIAATRGGGTVVIGS